jgi:hypothetical protein
MNLAICSGHRAIGEWHGLTNFKFFIVSRQTERE